MAGPGRSRGAGEPLDCHERALRLLSVRPRSRHELDTRLRRAGFEAADVEEELRRLEAVGLVDDEAFARLAVEHEVAVRRSGRRAIASRLNAFGVDRGVAEAALADVGEEEGRALALARERARRLGGEAPERAFPRLVAALARRGYAPELARRAARAALAIGDDGPDAS